MTKLKYVEFCTSSLRLIASQTLSYTCQTFLQTAPSVHVSPRNNLRTAEKVVTVN
jgi:hypothetical protein